MMGSASEGTSRYLPDDLVTMRKMATKTPTKRLHTIINMVAFLNPVNSYRTPATLGPTKAPNAKVDVQRPEMRPYVSRLLGNPYWIVVLKASVKEATSWAAIPRPWITRPTIVNQRTVSLGTKGAGPIKLNPTARRTQPITVTTLGCR
uniref:Uncharacterized protein n=1 Tax=Cacopsylla melanoneura TaxID=428564 RepID=A0A8D8UB90_9HEMI